MWRVVPDLGRCVRVPFRCKVFRAALDTASQGQMRPCDLRRSFANCLESAGIPRTRRQLYMGHGAKEMTDLYERHEVRAFIAQDSDHLARYIADDCQPKTRPSP